MAPSSPTTGRAWRLSGPATASGVREDDRDRRDHHRDGRHRDRERGGETPNHESRKQEQGHADPHQHKVSPAHLLTVDVLETPPVRKMTGSRTLTSKMLALTIFATLA